MKKLRLRIGATGLAGLLAAGSIVGAFALQNDALSQPSDSAPVGTIEDEPILYAGGYGLFPSH